MTAIPTGISEAHEVDVHLTCDEGLYTVPEQIVDRITDALRWAKAAHRAAGEIEVDAGTCTFDGEVAGSYLDEETAEAICPKCGTVHEVSL